MEIEISIVRDWIEYLSREIAAAGYLVEAMGSPEDLSRMFFNIRRRRVPILPRNVHESINLSCPEEYQAGYTALKKKFIKGEDVTPYLSKKILNASYEDPLLNDWGIHHFHLGENTKDGFVDRTGPLLFALIKDFDVYCICIKEHGAWTDQNLVEILHDEWPEAIVDYCVENVLDLEYQPADDDIAQFRKDGVQVILKIGGCIYAPIGGGYSTAGTSLQSVRFADYHLKLMRNIERKIHEEPGKFLDGINQCNLKMEGIPRFQLGVDKDGFYVVELNAKTRFFVAPHESRYQILFSNAL